jgi:hypothetical protein
MDYSMNQFKQVRASSVSPATIFLVLFCGVLSFGGESFAQSHKHAMPDRAQVVSADCVDNGLNQDITACKKEAAAAKYEAKHGGLKSPDAANAEQNAKQRCDNLPASDKEACRIRMLGAGTTSGSVEGGGILRKVVIEDSPTPTSEPQPEPSQAPPASDTKGLNK